MKMSSQNSCSNQSYPRCLYLIQHVQSDVERRIALVSNNVFVAFGALVYFYFMDSSTNRIFHNSSRTKNSKHQTSSVKFNVSLNKNEKKFSHKIHKLILFSYMIQIVIGQKKDRTKDMEFLNDSCRCKLDKQYVCSNLGTTYLNYCYMTCYREKFGYGGICKKSNVSNTKCICASEYSPVCGRNGLSYDNYCALQCNRIFMKHKGRCRSYLSGSP